MDLRAIVHSIASHSITEALIVQVEGARMFFLVPEQEQDPRSFLAFTRALLLPREESELEFSNRTFWNFSVIAVAEGLFLSAALLGTIETVFRATIYVGHIAYAKALSSFVSLSIEQQESLNTECAASCEVMNASWKAAGDAALLLYANLRV